MDPANRNQMPVYNMQQKRWEMIEPVRLQPQRLDFVEEEKSLDEKINDYLDQRGILTPEMREDIRNMIKEHEDE